MAIIWDGTGHTIRKAGKSSRVALSDFEPRGQENDRAIEARIRAAAEVDMSEFSVFVHIVSRVPLAYVIRHAPKGHIPKVDWWETSEE